MQLSEEITRVSGVKGEGFQVNKIKPVEIRKENGKESVQIEMLYIPEAGINLLGRDALKALQLNISFQPEVVIKVLTEEDEKTINPDVWVRENNRGGLQITLLEIELINPTEVVRQKQYNISMEGGKGLQPVIDTLLKDGILEPAMSPFNTPILPVKKPDGLRLLNQLVKLRHPVVPNP